MMIEECPNFSVCHKMMREGLKVCSKCFWRFKNTPLEFKRDKCQICIQETNCVKMRKCSHFACLKCFNNFDICPICRD